MYCRWGNCPLFTYHIWWNLAWEVRGITSALQGRQKIESRREWDYLENVAEHHWPHRHWQSRGILLYSTSVVVCEANILLNFQWKKIIQTARVKEYERSSSSSSSAPAGNNSAAGNSIKGTYPGYQIRSANHNLISNWGGKKATLIVNSLLQYAVSSAWDN